MRIVLGVDAEKSYPSAVRLLSRLRFKDAEVEPVAVMPTPTFYPGDPMGIPVPTEEIMDEVRKAAEEDGLARAKAAAELLKQEDLKPGDLKTEFGGTVQRLAEVADDDKAGLIAVGSGHKGPMRAFFTGSVGRGLMIGAHQSLLVAKCDQSSAGPVRAVLATDHSAYANACVDKLIELAPQGISELTVVTVYPKEMFEEIRPFLPDFSLDPTEYIEKGLEERNQAVIRKVAPALGCAATSKVMNGDVDRAIALAVKETGADLLILGAQGHGFAERLRLGSTSFHHVVSEPYSTLVLRLSRGEQPAAKA